MNRHDPVTRPFKSKQRRIISGRKLGVRFQVFVKMINRPRARRSAAGAEFGELRRLGRRVVDHRRLCGRQFTRSAVIDRFVDRAFWALWRADFARLKVDHRVRIVIADEQRPTIIAGFASLIDFVVTAWAAWAIGSGIGSDIAPIQISRLLIDTDSPRISASHHINLRVTDRAVFREKVPIGYRIGTVGFGANP